MFEVLVARVHDIYSNRILNVLMWMQDVSLQILPAGEWAWYRLPLFLLFINCCHVWARQKGEENFSHLFPTQTMKSGQLMNF